ncbi:chromosome segregation ATPase [Methanosarcina sp. Z-7115]|uniref:Chromosome segregation ATPase n=1 Tax=Methanosarcina baikalica TaxID=3073890 RepID=A0ABU2D2J0_9EURY|nr:chromosome segregation ATPase [Methanosarcina sp. Z-7115]MDR7666200.1 chromosome segregation ATPase [Methanosarcina sp. Z-7115]
MKKSQTMRYLAYLTILLTLLSALPGGSLAAKESSEHGNSNQDQYMREDARDSYENETNNSGDATDSESDTERLQNNLSVKDGNRISEYKDERKQLIEELQFHKKEYQEAKGDFLEIRNRIRTGKLDPNSEEALNATRTYLNSSINYMIAHLSNVKSNMEYSNGNETEEQIVAIDEKIKLLEVEKAQVAKASSQKEFLVVVRSVREVWDNAERTSLAGVGQTVSEKIGKFLEKSETLSEKLGTNIESLNETDIDKADLETKLASYKLYIKSAQERKEAADSIYSGENVTLENMETANNYLRQSLSEISKANNILRQIFDELKKYEIDKYNETGVESSLKTVLNNTKNVTGTHNS